MEQITNLRSTHILLVEDSLADIRLTQEALKECKLKLNLSITTDGEQAMDFLFRRNGFTDAKRPDLIILDLNLPKKDGREVLKEIKSDDSLKKIPVVILTVSTEERDILQAYDTHVNCYITKPLDLDKFGEVVQSIENFWFTIVSLPSDRP
ncbi:response regulator [Legionella sp.]|uniref:response regulator n=1 Tax=Legionella sp. TaxID=459 RepID=UPI0032200830